MAQVGERERTGVCPGLTRGAQLTAVLIVALALTFAQGAVSGASSRAHARKPLQSNTLKVKKPGQPTDVVAVGGNGSATISWNAPASNGGAAVTAYVVAMSHHQGCRTTSATTCTVTSLRNGTVYKIHVSRLMLLARASGLFPSRFSRLMFHRIVHISVPMQI